ncbi:MAG: mechanosensitive ion channel family protein [Vicinamibacterales bacterium]
MALLSAVARLVLVLAIVNAAITLVANKWRDDRPSDRFPGIVQDVTVIALFTAISTVLMREQLLTTSAVGAVVVGFALQDTLGNLFAGLAIQIEKPFRVGHWIALGEREGQVEEVTWRATKLRTKAGQFLIIPNSVIAKEPLLNFSQPTLPTRIEVEVGASYGTPPNDVKRAIREAIANAPLAMTLPEPHVVINRFGDSAIDYLAQFWVEDYAVDRSAKDQVRTNIWYEFRRRNIEIPWPIQIQYERDEEPARTDRLIDTAAAELSSVDLFSTLAPEARRALSASSPEHLFAAGEAIVRQGAAGDSMFVVLDGGVRVTLEPSGQEVARIAAGGFFGEMSMLTGEPRTATVRAAEDVRVLEITAQSFRDLALSTPGLVDHVTDVVTTRKVGLDEARATAAAIVPAHHRATLLERIQRYLRV